MRLADAKLFVRNIVRNKMYFGITVVGFALALTFVLLLSVYIRGELSVDNFHVNKERVFRLANEKGYGYSGPMANLIQQQFPEVECYSLFMLNRKGMVTLSPVEKVSYDYALVSPSFFKMFSFPLLEGSPDEVMREKHSMVVSRTLAKRLFGMESAVGKHIDIKGIPVLVSGVMEDIPENTHFAHFDAAVNIAGLSDYWGWKGSDVLESRGIQTFSLYLMGKPGSDLQAREKDIPELFRRHSFYTDEEAPQRVVVEPLEQIYFSPYSSGYRRYNSKALTWILAAIVMVILLLAIINYINLSVAQGGMRAREMSIKRLLGSSRDMLMAQFISESVALCFVAFLLACCFSIWVQPVFNGLMGAHVDLLSSLSLGFVLTALGLVLLLGVIAGAVPAWIVTRFNAVEVMKGAFRKKTKGTYGKALIGFQFAVAIVLTISTFVLMKQTRFMRDYDMGFNREHIARFSYVLDAEKKETLRNEVMRLAGVKEVAFVCGDPVDGGMNYTFDMDGRQLSFQSFRVDSSFFRMLGIRQTPTGLAHFEGKEYYYWSMVNGETQQVTLKTQPVWLNKEAVRQLGLGELPLEFKAGSNKEAVIGVVDNFHIRNLTQGIEPLMISLLQAPERPWNMLVQLQGDAPVTTFREIERVYKGLSAGTPFEAGFLDDFIHRWYERTGRISLMVGYLGMLAILLSAMGILAMATYFIQQRVKEIGIRRVNGATVNEIIGMLMNGYMKWIIVAFVAACPVAYYAMRRWLEDFAYRTSMDWWIFALAGIIAAGVAGCMICWQSWKAANRNPVEVLKQE